jgi:UDP-N-acetylmuramate--alanine ligase
MITLVLESAGVDPTYIVGGTVTSLGTNGRAGTGPYFVIEADEYRETFLGLSPKVAVVTNVEFDHPDCYLDLAHVERAFEAFIERIVPGGLLVACGDDPVARKLADRYRMNGGRVTLYGIAPSSALKWRASDVRAEAEGGTTFIVERDGASVDQISLQLPGRFNVVNALAALAVTEELGVDWEIARQALVRFAGTARRFEILGEARGVTVIDDYAHHPTQIQGVLQAARERYGERRVTAVWEPHTFSRVRALHDAFMAAFRDADRVVILPIYAARETDDGSLSASDLAERVLHSDVTTFSTLDQAVAHLAASAVAGEVVLLMGAGNEYLVGQRLLETLAAGEPS